MTIYTVTIQQTDDNMQPTGEIETIENCTMAEAKNIQKRNCGSIVTFVRTRKTAPVAKQAMSFYRGSEIAIVEERQNGWTLVSNVDGSRYFYLAVTAEIESR